MHAYHSLCEVLFFGITLLAQSTVVWGELTLTQSPVTTTPVECALRGQLCYNVPSTLVNVSSTPRLLGVSAPVVQYY